MPRLLLALLGASLAGCQAIPVYQVPPSVTDRATVRIDATDHSLLSAVVRVDYRPLAKACEPEAGSRLILKSMGNPLVKDINADGAQIPAGEPAALSGLWMADGGHCGIRGSFTPEKGVIYRLGLEGVRSNRDFVEGACKPILVALGSNPGDAAVQVPFKPIDCKATGGAAR